MWWQRWLARVQVADSAWTAARWATWIFLSITGLTGAAVIAAVIAWASTTWEWYWSTLNWAGAAIAFLIALPVLAASFLLVGLGVSAWRGHRSPAPTPKGPPSSQDYKDAEVLFHSFIHPA